MWTRTAAEQATNKVVSRRTDSALLLRAFRRAAAPLLLHARAARGAGSGSGAAKDGAKPPPARGRALRLSQQRQHARAAACHR